MLVAVRHAAAQPGMISVHLLTAGTDSPSPCWKVKSSHLLVCICLMLSHFLLNNSLFAVWADSEEPSAVDLVQREIGSRHILFTV